MNRFSLLLSVSVSMSIILMGCTAAATDSAGRLAQADVKAADFTLADLSGNTVSLSDFIGKKAVLMDFSTTWCPHCVNIIPALKGVYAKYNEKGIEVLGVYVNEPKQTIEAFVKQHKIPYAVLLDADGVVASRYGVRGVPTIVAIDKDGIIKYVGHQIPTEIIEKLAKQTQSKVLDS